MGWNFVLLNYLSLHKDTWVILLSEDLPLLRLWSLGCGSSTSSVFRIILCFLCSPLHRVFLFSFFDVVLRCVKMQRLQFKVAQLNLMHYLKARPLTTVVKHACLIRKTCTFNYCNFDSSSCQKNREVKERHWTLWYDEVFYWVVYQLIKIDYYAMLKKNLWVTLNSASSSLK